jgi:penicillin-binding protein 1C
MRALGSTHPLTLYRRRSKRHWRQGGRQGLGGVFGVALRAGIVVAAIGLLVIMGSALAAVGSAAAVYAAYAQELPEATEISALSTETFETTRIYDRTGQHLLWEIFPEDAGRRTWVPLAQIPEHLRNATIATEDRTFYTNPAGINVEGLARAVWGELTGEDRGGGSSIAQQLVRNVIMTHEERMERSYVRKLKEAILAFELTRQYPGIEGRDMILEWYLNNIFYGHFAYGVEAAAQTYFNKSVSDLTLAEAAMIVPLGQSPARNPIDRPEDAKRYQEVVLDEMVRQGYITPEEAWAAKQEVMTIASPRFDMQVPHWVLYVQDTLIQRFGRQATFGGGLQVITTIDLEAQAKAQEIAREHVAELRDRHEVTNAAVVVMDTRTAEIVAMVGSLDYHDREIDGQVNMALAPRQPGSSFKPFTYATAFAQGYTPATMVMDVRTSFPDFPNPAPYVPENYSRTFHGPMLLRRALACSYNVPAVAVQHMVGTMNVVELAHSMGITTLNNAHYGLALTLGGGDVKLLDMVYAFTVFANNGDLLGVPIVPETYRSGHRQLDPVAILKVTDATGNVVYEYTEPQRQEVLRPEVAYLITDILADNQARTPAFGANSFLVVQDRPAAAKTGTTNEFHDGWTVGYTPQYAVGVWVGNADYKRMENLPGARGAAPIWQGVMEWLHDGLPILGFERPPGLVTAIVDGTSGKLPTQYSAGRTQELFIEGTVPTESDDVHRPVRICTASGKLATSYCSEGEVETKVFEIYPPEADDWVREREIPQPPSEHCDVHGPNLSRADVAIVQPTLLQTISGVSPIIGNAKLGGMSRFWIEYGPGMDPTSWVRITPDHGHRVENGVLTEWNTGGLDGLYTLRLGVQDGGGGIHYASVAVLVDNAPPDVTILSPEEDKTYVMDRDEWINIQAYVVDNMAMDRVEFYLNGEKLGFSTVAPYTMRWNLKMERIQPDIDWATVQPSVEMIGDEKVTIEITQSPEGRVYTRTVEVGGVMTVTKQIESGPEGSYRILWDSGREVVSNSGGYTETHAIHVMAYDQAGNMHESAPVRVNVIPKPKEEDGR